MMLLWTHCSSIQICFEHVLLWLLVSLVFDYLLLFVLDCSLSLDQCTYFQHILSFCLLHILAPWSLSLNWYPICHYLIHDLSTNWILLQSIYFTLVLLSPVYIQPIHLHFRCYMHCSSMNQSALNNYQMHLTTVPSMDKHVLSSFYW